MIRPGDELDTAMAAAQAGGAVALAMQGQVTSRTKSDGSPVTDGDLAADAAVRQVLAARRSDDAILSEEMPDDPGRLSARRLWIIDPIDGTKDYLAGAAEWAVQVAVAVDGRLAAAALAIPREGVVIAGGPGLGCWLRDAAGTRPYAAIPCPAPCLITSRSPRNADHVARVRTALPEFAWSPTTSVGVKVWRMLQGVADLFVHPRSIAEWDAAAPAGVLAAAGGTATDLAGAPLVYNSPAGRCPGLIFSTRTDHAALCARLGAAGVVI
jgi:3'-phosphoadenosine 5'-phosphosulfate (PAPS) 3'-phosphatase